jgi:hypothetical protein
MKDQDLTSWYRQDAQYDPRTAVSLIACPEVAELFMEDIKIASAVARTLKTFLVFVTPSGETIPMPYTHEDPSGL